MRSVSVSGTTVSYRRDGRGPGLLLLHGTNSDGRSGFGHLITHFTGHRTVITPDYAGAGRSTLPEGPLSVELLAGQVAAVVTDYGEGPVDLLGTSLGAVVAAATAASRPELVRRLVLVAGWAGPDARHRLVFETWKRLQQLDPELGTRFGLALAFSPPFLAGLGQERLGQLTTRGPATATDRRIDLGLRADIRRLLPRITAPTLVVGLTRDQLVPVEHSRALHAAIPDSRYAEIDSGHAVHLEKPDELVRLTRAFLLPGTPPDLPGTPPCPVHDDQAGAGPDVPVTRGT